MAQKTRIRISRHPRGGISLGVSASRPRPGSRARLRSVDRSESGSPTRARQSWPSLSAFTATSARPAMAPMLAVGRLWCRRRRLSLHQDQPSRDPVRGSSRFRLCPGHGLGRPTEIRSRSDHRCREASRQSVGLLDATAGARRSGRQAGFLRAAALGASSLPARGHPPTKPRLNPCGRAKCSRGSDRRCSSARCRVPARPTIIVMKFFASFSVMCGGSGGTLGSA